MKLYCTKLHGDYLIVFCFQIIICEYKLFVVRYMLKVEYSNIYQYGESRKPTYLYMNLSYKPPGGW
jgi:hypothetical protein